MTDPSTMTCTSLLERRCGRFENNLINWRRIIHSSGFVESGKCVALFCFRTGIKIR